MITEQNADHPIAVIVESTEETMDRDEDGLKGWRQMDSGGGGVMDDEAVAQDDTKLI
jgi:hypothetical protein